MERIKELKRQKQSRMDKIGNIAMEEYRQQHPIMKEKNIKKYKNTREYQERCRVLGKKDPEVCEIMKKIEEALEPLISCLTGNASTKIYGVMLETVKDYIRNSETGALSGAYACRGDSWLPYSYETIMDQELCAIMEEESASDNELEFWEFFFDEPIDYDLAMEVVIENSDRFSLRDAVLDTYPECRELLEEISEQELDGIIHDAIPDFWKEASEYLEDYLDDETVIALTEEGNPEMHAEYAKAKMEAEQVKRKREEYERKQQEQKAEEDRKAKEAFLAVLDHIPENPAELYPEARHMRRNFVLHIGPTNSGKTYEAMQAFYAAETGVYLAPLRLLAYEAYESAQNARVPCNMITGEELIRTPDATHDASTIEMADLHKAYRVAVIDEAQMLADRERGGSWTAAILGIQAEEVHVCASPDARPVLEKLILLCGDTFRIQEHERQTPLLPDSEPFRFPEGVKKGDALIVFSKRSVIAVAAKLQSMEIATSVVYGALPYEVRRSEVGRFIAGETDVLVATDAIGMGMNMPIRRVVFLETEKFDGNSQRGLTSAEVKQIAGRAGRRGIFEEGYYLSEFDRKGLRKKMDAELTPIETVYQQFPESLLYADGKLSDFFRMWNKIKPETFIRFGRVDTDLCVELESATNDKFLIWDFLTIPFNKKSEEEKYLWKSLFRLRCQKKLYGDSGYEDTALLGMIPPVTKTDNLQELETSVHLTDILYNYMRKFGCNRHMQTVLRIRKELTDRIIQILKTQKLQERKCRECGRPLPWNYPYGICEQCYNRRRSYYYDDYDDWDGDDFDEY